MSNNVITIRKETAQSFLPADMHRRGAIDLHELSKLAKEAMEGSELSLAAATEIADGNFISRLWNSGEMQKHIIQSISYLGDISKVNLGLSAICNDLAAANLEHASRIDKNHHATNQQLNQVQQLTAELLAHLRKPREPACWIGCFPLVEGQPGRSGCHAGLVANIDGRDRPAIRRLAGKPEKLSQQNDDTVESVTRFRVEIASLSEALTNQKADAVQQLGLLSSRLSASVSVSTQRADKTDATIRKSHEVLAAALTTLNQQLARHQSEFQTAIQSEHASRDAMQQAILSLIKQREGAIRTTIGELNQHLLKRMLWGAGGIVVLQVLGFGFLAFKMGLFK
jgi:hypothetical protein